MRFCCVANADGSPSSASGAARTTALLLMSLCCVPKVNWCAQNLYSPFHLWHCWHGGIDGNALPRLGSWFPLAPWVSDRSRIFSIFLCWVKGSSHLYVPSDVNQLIACCLIHETSLSFENPLIISLGPSLFVLSRIWWIDFCILSPRSGRVT